MTDAEIKEAFAEATKMLTLTLSIVGDPELNQVLARSTRTMFQAFLNVGFTEDQAMMLVASHSSKMSAPK